MWFKPGTLPGLAALALAVGFSSSCNAQAVPPVGQQQGVSAWAFDMSQVTLSTGRFFDNQARTLTYLKWIDVDRLLYVFRKNHGLSTNNAQPNAGWDAPDFPFRSHVQGHFLNAWANCYSQLQDAECKRRATYFAAELKKCQDNNSKVGFNKGYLSGFPEADIDAVEKRTLTSGNVPYYAIHKTMSGLLDVWRHVGDTNARDVLLAMAAWVDLRTGKLTYQQMQNMMGTEFGGMNEVLADLYHQTGDQRWITVAQRFDHAAIFDPLASNRDSLNGLHANTQVPKWIGASREYKATGTSRYQDIARNAWNITVSAHSYAIGGNSQAEHFRLPNAIAGYLTTDTCEACNTYNMLKLTRELWLTNPSTTTYFDFYERALLNHLLGQQDPSNSHGHVTYFTPLNPGGRRGVGPAWGGGTWSTDYNSFWCCQGTGIETNTKLMDSIYFYDNSALYVNLFIPSVLRWTQRGVTVTQTTSFPQDGTSTFKITGSGKWIMRVRIPAWATGAQVTVNGQAVQGSAGSYAAIDRTWASGDTVVVKLPMRLQVIPANDNPNVAALAFGPVILSGNYGSNTLSATPALDLATVKRSGTTGLAFTATAGGKTVNLGPFYDAQGFNYNVYWSISGKLPA
ncbi:putative secreted protein [Colletotrichum sublineola]|uniref:Putative secreted protein n=1 Tax=Colletotrichum sublineola TaxID=1173701 RepID=A0A066WYA0_COLSU|nr:putative secreted protein [Colletotrichum sublineola]